MTKIKFKLKEEHIKLLRSSYVDFDVGSYRGAAAIDIKCPYGNSSVLADIHEILEGKRVDNDDDLSDKLKDKYFILHRETADALQIILVTGKFEPGVYERDQYNVTSWKKVS